MSDIDRPDGAWIVPPSAYLASRPASFTVPPAPRSCYVTMRDGCRLAVDVYLPEANDGAAAPATFAAIAILTPYYRRFKLAAPGADPSPNAARYRDFFVPRGYALVVVDVRGTGASFGTREALRSPKEREDYREIADWIVRQPWSSGVIGTTGISYLGAAACFMASTAHPAVKAAAPLFAVSDIYSEQLFPGGVMCTTVTDTYDELMQALDLDQRDKLGQYAYFADPSFRGPQPVDEDPDGTLVAAALEEHRDSFRLRDLAPELAYREEPPAHDPGLHTGACSPYHYLGAARGKVAMYSISGWYDGAAYANASVSRFLTLRGPHDRLLLGPWDHGARTNGSPWRDATEPRFPLLAEVLRFFDEHLLGRDTGLAKEAPIHFHTVHAETWQAAKDWPPVARTETWHLAPDGALARDKPATAAVAPYQVRFTTGTGRSSRFERLGAFSVADYYGDWDGREDRLLSFTSAPLDEDLELSGHVVAHLQVATSERDASVFAYLSEVEPSGRSRYVTEGLLRALHRATCAPPPEYRTTWPFRAYRRADAKLMQPGVPERLSFALLPISWRFPAGSRLRLSIAGTDADHFAQVPHGRPPLLQVVLGGPDGSVLELPLRRPG